MKILCAFGQYNYGNKERGVSYEYANFLPALRRLGYDIVFFDSWDKSAYHDFSDLNRQFLNIVVQQQPDIVLCATITCELWLETLSMARQASKAAFVHWNSDDSWKYEQCSRLIAAEFDLMVTTYPSALKKADTDGLNNFFLSQWAANSDTMREPLPAADCRYPVSFVGTAYGNRIRWVEELQQRGLEIACFGHGWEHGAVNAEDIPHLIRESVISLNFGDSAVVMKGLQPVHSRQIKARVFEVPGAGGLLLTEPADFLGDFYRIGEDIAVYDTIETLVEKINDLLANPQKRDAMAASGHRRTRQEHTYELRFQSLLRAAIDRRTARLLEHEGKADGIDLEYFESLTVRHQAVGLLSFLVSMLRSFCVLIWGKQRGPRAARRFLFELSWRLLGRKTYTARGWPGRFFYKES